jgi:hypothetical protein
VSSVRVETREGNAKVRSNNSDCGRIIPYFNTLVTSNVCFNMSVTSNVCT